MTVLLRLVHGVATHNFYSRRGRVFLQNALIIQDGTFTCGIRQRRILKYFYMKKAKMRHEYLRACRVLNFQNSGQETQPERFQALRSPKTSIAVLRDLTPRSPIQATRSVYLQDWIQMQKTPLTTWQLSAHYRTSDPEDMRLCRHRIIGRDVQRNRLCLTQTRLFEVGY